MARKKQASFKMKGHTLPGVNQKSETANKADGRSPSSAFQQKSSPNKIVGLAAGLLAKPLIKGAKKLFGGGAGGGEEEGSKELLEGTGKTVEEVTGFKVSGGGDAGGGDATTDATTPITPTTPTTPTTPNITEPDEVLTMKSPNKKKLKTGIKTKVGGKLNEGTSPHQKL